MGNRVPPEPAAEQHDLDLNMQPPGTGLPEVPPAPGTELPAPDAQKQKPSEGRTFDL
jgi:hypothetical protein